MDIEEFRTIYERHVGYVAGGDMKAALADMLPENLATVFDGVVVPRDGIISSEIRSVRADGDRFVGETVYHTADGAIGLQSRWVNRDGRWLAAELENFATDAAS